MSGPIANYTGTLASVTRSAAPFPKIRGAYNFSLWGTFSATARLVRSFDGGTTWIPVSKDSSGADASFTAPCGVTGVEPEDGVIYAVECTTFVSGTINYRISQ